MEAQSISSDMIPRQGSHRERQAKGKQSTKRFQSPVRLLVIALALALTADLLFYGKALGISVLCFVFLLLNALFLLGRREGVRPVHDNLWLLVPLFFFAAMVCVRANLFLTSLNVLATLTLLGLIAHFYAAGRAEALGIAGYLAVPLRAGGNALVRAAPLVPAAVDLKSARERGGRNLLPVLRGLLLALPVLIVFTSLLASADLVFARYLQDLSRFAVPPATQELLWRGVIVLCAAWVLAGGLVYALSRREASGEGGKAPGTLSTNGPLGFVETATLLILVSGLFLLFVRIQFAYLFGGRENVILGDLTYAQYARRGFFELVAVSLLTLGLIRGLDRITRRQTGGQARLFNALGSLLAGLVLVLLSSAFQRLHLYEMAYGYTELRLYVYVFMVWLAIAFLWLLVALWRWPKRFAIGGFVAALGFLATLNVLNPDAFITRQNLARYQSTGKLDALYLASLSEDAVPVLVQALRQVSGSRQSVLRDHLRYRFEHMEIPAGWRQWPSFHLARWQAYRVLTQNQTAARIFPSAPVPQGKAPVAERRDYRKDVPAALWNNGSW